MKILRLALILLLSLAYIQNHAQFYNSNCEAPDSITEQYLEDAHRMAMAKFFKYDLTEKDSVNIPLSHVDTVLNALIAVYNAFGLPARDTVVDLLNIHALALNAISPFYVDLKGIIIQADSTLPWMQQLQTGAPLSGDHFIDSLFIRYDAAVVNYMKFNNVFYWHLIDVKSSRLLNTIAFAKLFENYPGISSASAFGLAGDGAGITDTIYSDRVSLTYSYGWMDCPSGCMQRRYWKFNVYYDCVLEYVGSYGHPLLFTGVNQVIKPDFNLSPNPTMDMISIKLPENINFKKATVHVFDLSGRILFIQQLNDSFNMNVGHLEKGHYFVRLFLDEEIFSVKSFIKL
jgi:hypothetical protein